MSFNFKVKLRDKNIFFRKWKVKDRNKFLESTKNESVLGVKESLVYDCLKDDLSLSDEEYNYVLMHIRDKSITDEITYVFECDCKNSQVYTLDLLEVMTGTNGNLKEIKVGAESFEMGNIRNKEFYESAKLNLNKTEQYLVDFILHIDRYNGKNCTFDELKSTIDEMDIDVFENVFKQWEKMRFKVDNTAAVKCTACGSETVYEFDDLPNFFPSSWHGLNAEG